MKKERCFKSSDLDGNEISLVFRRPTQKVINRAELIGRAAFSNALRENVLLNAEARKMLRERGLYTEEDERKEQGWREEISRLEDALKEAGDEDGRKLCEQIVSLRAKIREHNSVISSIMENTCEAIAADERNRFIAAECTYSENGSRVFNSVEDFKGRLVENDPVCYSAYSEAMIASLEGVVGRELPSDLSSEYAENKWLSEKGLLDTEGEVEEQKPKRRRKKTT